ncbi:MAG: VOC family protein [Woeseiaceae bacterium]|nr:VOC family protein [Woeseiaceae bacterium]
MRKCSLFLLLVLGASISAAGPVPEQDRVPIDLRRTTLIVRDLDASLAFYRDALGMEVIYDNEILSPRDAASVDESDRASRLVFLRANDDYVGVLGLLEYLKPVRPAHNQGDEPFSTGSMVLLFNAEDLAATFARARSVNRVRVLHEPVRVEYPSYDGDGKIPVMVSILIDPDGFVVELNQLLVEDLGQ